mgnify:CR=1 FL=1|tara:strand:+ start:312 stop:581 length:270 start_codon:yes stop_codon:yes gene_type:complete
MEIDKLPNVKKYWINDGYLNIELKDNHLLRMNFNDMETLKKQLTLTDVSQQRELLPEFLMEDLDGKIITSVIGSSDVTKEWNEYLGNCG